MTIHTTSNSQCKGCKWLKGGVCRYQDRIHNDFLENTDYCYETDYSIKQMKKNLSEHHSNFFI